MKMRIHKLYCAPLLALFAVACGGDDDETDTATKTLPLSVAGDAVEQYADIVSASYGDSLTSAEALDAAIDSFAVAPSAAGFTAAQNAWRASRLPYLQTEVYRFYDGPIDNPEDGPEGQLNAWPLDEEYIDYIAGPNGDTAGMINDPAVTIDAETITGANEVGGEKNISTGYHAIEFLLWGQDSDPEGPGARPFTDYVVGDGGTMANQDRRALYLTTASSVLLADLESLVEAWSPDGASNYRASFVAEEPADALTKIMSGMIILSGFETGGERLQAALDVGEQEEEHSCFSDNTHVDMIEDVRGVQNVWLGSYERLNGTSVSGTGIRDVIAAGDAALAEQITDQIAESLDLAEALRPPFDQEIAPGNTEGNARVEALIESLRAQSDLLAEAFQLYGLERIPDPTP
jgi:putative iron-regulated protein